MDSTSENKMVKLDDVKAALTRAHVSYDRKGDEHYHCASALQKSIRGSDANAALYWTMRMFAGGEDPMFIARRLVRTAAEDVGLGDPQVRNKRRLKWVSILISEIVAENNSTPLIRMLRVRLPPARDLLLHLMTRGQRPFRLCEQNVNEN